MASYYIANAGSDSNNGTSPATSIKTIAHLNTLTLNPGDSVLFNRGDTWNTITDAAPVMRAGVTYDAYGAAPVLEGSGFSIPMPGGQPDLKVNDWVTNAPILDAGKTLTGWSSYTGGVSDAYVSDNFSTVTAGADLSTSVPQIRASSDIWTDVLDVSTGHMIATASGRIRRANTIAKSWYTLQGGAGQPAFTDYSITGTFFVASVLTIDFMGLIARLNPSAQGDQYNVQAYITQDGSWKLVSSDNGAITTIASAAAGTVTLTVGSTITIRLDVLGTTATMFINGSQVGTGSFAATKEGAFALAGGSVGFFLGSGSSTAQTDTTGFQATSFLVTPLNDQTTPMVATYQAPLASDAGLYALRGVFCQRGNGPNVLQDGQVAWSGGVVYVATTGGIPGATDFVYGGSSNIIVGGAVDNVVIRGLTFRHSGAAAISWGAAPTSLTLDGVQMDRVASQQIGGLVFGAINVQNANGLVIKNCVLRNLGADAIHFNQCPSHQIIQNRVGPMYGPTTNVARHTGADIAYNAVYRNNYSTYSSANATGKGHYVPDGSAYTFQGNYMEYGNFGIGLGNGTNSNITMTGNIFNRIGAVDALHYPGGAIRVVDNVSVSVTNLVITRNLIIDCPSAVVAASFGTGSPTKQFLMTNNTIVNISVPPAAQNPPLLGSGEGYQVTMANSVFVSGTFKNNILWNATGSGKLLEVKAPSGWASDYNVIGPDAVGAITYISVSYDTLVAYAVARSQDAHSIASDPKFANQNGPVSAASYALTYRSPARNMGTPATATADSWGPPDVGATEYVVGYWGVAA